MKKFLLIFLVMLMVLAGLGLMFYPDISTWWNSRTHSGLVQVYNEEVARMDEFNIEEHFRRAKEYNAALQGNYIMDPFADDRETAETLSSDYYLDTLNISGTMAHIEIPAIDVSLPVFHTTNTDVLSRGIGHMEGTSFPIGGQGTHAVLTGHSGLPFARMFTDLEELVIGDLFFINVLNERLAYEVDQIITVLPHEVESLRIDRAADYVTLITCTPYAINTHRLLVRGARIPYEPGMAEAIELITGAINWRLVIIIVGVLLFLLIFITCKRIGHKKKRTEREWVRIR
ncbi:MAG: class C sortase [Oscillospiraceae bacterium]|nr:class C sortase [Oscillospiraceae bacterium]